MKFYLHKTVEQEKTYKKAILPFIGFFYLRTFELGWDERVTHTGKSRWGGRKSAQSVIQF